MESWAKVLELPTGETLEIRMELHGGDVRVRSVMAHSRFEHDDLAVNVKVPLKHRPGHFNFHVQVLPTR